VPRKHHLAMLVLFHFNFLYTCFENKKVQVAVPLVFIQVIHNCNIFLELDHMLRLFTTTFKSSSQEIRYGLYVLLRMNAMVLVLLEDFSRLDAGCWMLDAGCRLIGFCICYFACSSSTRKRIKGSVV
jgi:hypothetical protein